MALADIDGWPVPVEATNSPFAKTWLEMSQRHPVGVLSSMSPCSAPMLQRMGLWLCLGRRASSEVGDKKRTSRK